MTPAVLDNADWRHRRHRIQWSKPNARYPRFDGSNDFIGIGGPHEGLGVIVAFVGFLQEAVDGGLEIDDRAKEPAFEASLGEFGEEALDRIEPRNRGPGVMEDKRGCRSSQARTLACLCVA
jgi:hypothetical protein